MAFFYRIMKSLVSFYKIMAFNVHRLLVLIDPRIEMTRCYYKVFRKLPNFKNPVSLIEKIYWMQLNSDTSMWTQCADKYAVRDYVRSLGLGEYLNEQYYCWDSPEDISFEDLPQSFVLKTTHACDQVIIVKDKEKLDKEAVVNQFRKWVSHPFGYSGSELHYLLIPRRIIAEKYLESPNGQESQIDYKIWCFSGKPYCILVVYGRNSNGVNVLLYDLEWNPMFQYLKTSGHVHVNITDEIEKPGSLSKMLEIASALSSRFPQVRVDLFEYKGIPVFGELTFSTGFGYFTDDFYDLLGSKVSS